MALSQRTILEMALVTAQRLAAEIADQLEALEADGKRTLADAVDAAPPLRHAKLATPTSRRKYDHAVNADKMNLIVEQVTRYVRRVGHTATPSELYSEIPEIKAAMSFSTLNSGLGWAVKDGRLRRPSTGHYAPSS